jgi:hypothetical protein
MLILDKYAPEEYASFWGCDPQYCREPQLPNDGYLMYNFSSSINERTKEYLLELHGAIERLIQMVSADCLIHPFDKASIDFLEEKKEDLEGLEQLKNHVGKLLENKS